LPFSLREFSIIFPGWFVEWSGVVGLSLNINPYCLTIEKKRGNSDNWGVRLCQQRCVRTQTDTERNEEAKDGILNF